MPLAFFYSREIAIDQWPHRPAGFAGYLDCVYFTLTTSATLGSSGMYPTGAIARALIVCLFVGLGIMAASLGHGVAARLVRGIQPAA